MAYQIVHTNYGVSQIAAANASGAPINLTHFAVGDGLLPSGGGSSWASRTTLVNERWRATVSQVYVDSSSPGRFVIEGTIPYNVGGWTIREFGIFDAAGQLVAIGDFPPTYKSVPGDAAVNDLVIRVVLTIGNASAVSVMIDPSVAVASQAWVLTNINAAHIIPGGTTGQRLAKASNNDGHFQWVDPTVSAVIVDGIEESATVAAGQSAFNLSVVTTVGLAVYVDGVRVPHQAGPRGWQQGTSQTQVVLGKQYPEGSAVLFVQNDPAGQIGQPLQAAQNLADVANAAAARANLGVMSLAEASQLAPAGHMAFSARATAPVGWLVANGAAVSRTTYATLFAAIGTVYGAGDGSTTFNLPDGRGVFWRGLDSGRGLDAGRALGTYQADEFKAHTHELRGTNDGWNAGRPAMSDRGWQSSYNTEPAGGSETRPKNIALLPLIKY